MPLLLLTPPPQAQHQHRQQPPKSPPSVTQILAKLRQQSKPLSDISSGPQPQTHPPLAEDGVTSSARVSVEQRDRFLCAGAVDAAKLLRGSRTSLLAKAVTLGANCLVDEHWRCTIYRCKSRQSDPVFRVHIRYLALATRSTCPDPNKPIALDKAKCHTGLMTILRRD